MDKSLADLIKEEKKEPEDIIIEKPETRKEPTFHKDKKFKSDKFLDKIGLMSKIIEIMQIHLKEIPIDWLRAQLLSFDLVSHRKQLKIEKGEKNKV